MITDLRLEDPPFNLYGLQSVVMSRLGRLVVVAGANGTGKTRLLRAIVDAYPAARNSQRQLDGMRQLGLTGPDDALTRRAAGVRATAPRVPVEQAPVLLSYARQPDVARVAVMTPEQVGRNAGEIRQSIDYERVHRNIEVYLTHLAKGLFYSQHPKGGGVPEVKDTHQQLEKFNGLSSALLGTTLDYALLGNEIHPTLFGRRFEPGELSTGQMVLLYWASVLARRPGQMRDGIVCIDEPELHLHPAAANQAIRTLLDDVVGPTGQLWVATHSLPLIAELCAKHGLDVLYHASNGEIRHAGSSIGVVTEGLLGGEHARETLLSFLGTTDEVTFAHFAAQCLLAAEAVEHFDGDRQAEQVVARVESERGLHILDYCAGRGRIAQALAARESPATGLTFTTYHDLRYTERPELDECARSLERLQARGATVHMYLADADEVPSLPVPASEWRDATREDARADVVMLANTLHEVHPNAWSSFLRRIQQVSKPDGKLLLIEDQEPRIGELPTPSGFLILNTHELETLFRSPEPLCVTRSPDQRLTLHEIPCNLLGNVTARSIHEAIEKLIDRLKEKILRMRAGTSPASGRRHALYAMTLANALLARDAMPAADH